MRDFARAGLAGLLLAAGVDSAAAEPVGVWQRPSGEAHMEIAPCGAHLCGTLVHLDEDYTDDLNPDPALRGRPLLGTRIVHEAVATDRPGRWRGRLYNAEDGRTYQGFLVLEAADALRLEGCVLGGLICKGETWQRVR